MSIQSWRGYFGKIPQAGDFVSHGLPRAVETVFDDWLRSAMRHSQKALGRKWLDAFLVSPVWRFALAGGVVGPQAVRGVMMPSVDRIGRYFPLLILCAGPGMRAPDGAPQREDDPFFDAAETLAMSCLRANVPPAVLREEILRLPIQTSARALPTLTDEQARSAVWWTGRSHDRSFRTAMLPQAQDFHTCFLISSSVLAPTQHKSRKPLLLTADHALDPAPPPVEDPDPEPDPKPPSPLLHVDAASASLRGTRSPNLTDAAAISEDRQAFSLLSGIGHSPALAGQVKSLVPIFESISNPFSMSDLVAEAKGKLGTANARLTARAEASGDTCAVAALVLLIQARRYAVIWAGHGSAYLARGGTLHLLNRPHTDRRLRGIVTRALGARRSTQSDNAIGEVEAGDRFLLASPGLSGTLPDTDIADMLARAANPQSAVTELTQNALIAGAALDATALCVFLSARGDDTTQTKSPGA